jgi:hypothetical protein
MEEFSITKRKADELIAELVRLELIRRSEFQPEKDVIRYETTIQGNALALAKAGKPVSRASADRVLEEFLGRVKSEFFNRIGDNIAIKELHTMPAGIDKRIDIRYGDASTVRVVRG